MINARTEDLNRPLGNPILWKLENGYIFEEPDFLEGFKPEVFKVLVSTSTDLVGACSITLTEIIILLCIAKGTVSSDVYARSLLRFQDKGHRLLVMSSSGGWASFFLID